jgi:protein ImuB
MTKARAMSAAAARFEALRERQSQARRKLTVVPGTHSFIEPPELWIAVVLPMLALEALQRPSDSHPQAVLEPQSQTQHIVACNVLARRAGIRRGMSLSAALALLPELQTISRDERSERQMLEQLATLAQRFSPRVSCEPPDGLVLEVKGSLRLFGGAENLCRTVEAEIRAAGARPIVALAPTPLAALTSAYAGKSILVLDSAQLIGQLAPLPLRALRWPPEALERLARAGVRTIGEALRLPRVGFARRFGRDLLAMLDRMTGRDADPRIRFEARERFRRRRELLYELENQTRILEMIEPLLQELERFLQARQCGITELDCVLRHPHAEPTRCPLRLAAPVADSKHLARLLGERLSTLSLPEPVRACELRSGPLIPRVLSSESLWQAGEHGGSVNQPESVALIEHLRARLGAEAVYGLQLIRDHRPEAMWRPVEPGAAETVQPPWPASRRPLWLLPAPQLLSQRGELPCTDGPLRLLGDPERIETGWWDGADVARDYYKAIDIHGARLWVFRERLPPHRWFLHGAFG